jgi:hypothetical protein
MYFNNIIFLGEHEVLYKNSDSFVIARRGFRRQFGIHRNRAVPSALPSRPVFETSRLLVKRFSLLLLQISRYSCITCLDGFIPTLTQIKNVTDIVLAECVVKADKICFGQYTDPV